MTSTNHPEVKIAHLLRPARKVVGMRTVRRRRRKKAEREAENMKPVQPANAPPEEQTQTIQRDLDRALRHHTAGRLPQAESIFQRILQTDPSQPVTLRMLGDFALQVGKNDIAVDLITKALAIKPDYAEAHCKLGNALKALGKPDGAVASYRKALAIKPDYAVAHGPLLGERA